MTSRFIYLGPWLVFIVLLILIDQSVKFIVETTMDMNEKIDLMPFFALYRTHNDGIAFSMLAGLGPLGLLALSSCIVVGVIILAIRCRPEQKLARIGFALIIAGAIGNIIDRAVMGYVVDYFLFFTQNWSFAVFNFADAFISIGVAFVIAGEFFDKPYTPQNEIDEQKKY